MADLVIIKRQYFSSHIKWHALSAVLLVFLSAWELKGQSTDGNFRASVVKVDITPDEPQWLRGYGPRQSEGTHDRIYHRIVGLDDGNTQFFLISTEVNAVSPSFYDEFCRELESATGIRRSQVWWTTTHTHSAPEVGFAGLQTVMMPERYEHEPNPEYTEWMKAALIEGVTRAQESLEPARLGVGTGMSMANINRRAIDVNGRASLGMNPDAPVDRQIGLIRLERNDGSPLAFIANYAIHATVLGGRSRLISGDAPGIVSEYVEEELGAPMLFINGAAGDVAPIYSGLPDVQSSRLMQFKVLLGDRILAANRSIARTTSDVTLWLGERIVETPLKEDFEWIDEMADYHRVTSTGVEMVRIPVRFLRINEDIAIWSAPLELFTEIAMDIRNHSPFLYTFFYGYSNGTLHYLPTEKAFSEGGYETGRVTVFTERAEQDFTQAVISYLQSLPRGLR